MTSYIMVWVLIVFHPADGAIRAGGVFLKKEDCLVEAHNKNIAIPHNEFTCDWTVLKSTQGRLEPELNKFLNGDSK
jgi:hypothetical protein